MDERVIPNFAYEENGVNPLMGKRMRLDPAQFNPVVDDYLTRLGWDLETGWPTAQRLAELDLDIHEEMVAGARDAQDKTAGSYHRWHRLKTCIDWIHNDLKTKKDKRNPSIVGAPGNRIEDNYVHT